MTFQKRRNFKEGINLQKGKQILGRIYYCGASFSKNLHKKLILGDKDAPRWVNSLKMFLNWWVFRAHMFPKGWVSNGKNHHTRK